MIWPFHKPRPERRALAAAVSLTPDEIRTGSIAAQRRLEMLQALYPDTHPEVMEARRIARVFAEAEAQLVETMQ